MTMTTRGRTVAEPEWPELLELLPRHVLGPARELGEKEREPRRARRLEPRLVRVRHELGELGAEAWRVDAGVVPPGRLEGVLDDEVRVGGRREDARERGGRREQG